MIPELKQILKQYKDDYTKNASKKEITEERIKQNTDRIKELEEYNKTLNLVNVLLQKTAEYQRKEACQKLEEVATSALRFVKGQNYALKIELKEVRKRPEAYVYVVSNEDGVEVRNEPQNARGGGIVDIVSIALKVAVIETYEPLIDGPILFDEPGKHVSQGYIEPLSEFIRTILQKLDRQGIVVTHQEHLAQSADKKIRIRLENGVSVVE